jgi:hypothetical protein
MVRQNARQCIFAAMLAVVVVIVIVALAAPAIAVQPPGEGCRPVAKIEYNSAKKQYLLRNRFDIYLRTGRIWRRRYWYCPQ